MVQLLAILATHSVAAVGEGMIEALNLDMPITLVMDNARYQKCNIVTALASQLNIELLYLPAYSPNINLIERLWKFVKKKKVL